VAVLLGVSDPNLPIPGLCGVLHVQPLLSLNLGSADASGTADTSVVTGTITGGTLTPGVLSTYRLGGGGGTLDIQKDDHLTGGNTVVIGDSDLFKGTTTKIKVSNGQNYTGPTIVRAGTYEVAGALSGITSVSLTAGSLMLAASDRINNAASVAFAGGTLNTGGFSEGSASSVGLGTLTLSATSTLDFGAGSGSQLLFAGVGAHTGGAVLNILNWSWNGGGANGNSDGDDDRLMFVGDDTARQDFLTNFANSISFGGVASFDAIQFDANHFEIVAIPEPSSTAILGAAALIGLIGFRERRRLRRPRRA
jgi:hypothetical protein